MFILQGKHSIYTCKGFLELSIEKRIQEVKATKLCLNCLKERHLVFQCKAGKCKECHKKHNTLLHVAYRHQSAESDDAAQDVSTIVSNYNSNVEHVLLSTAIIY